MSELGDRLSNRRLNQRRTSSFDGSHDMLKMLRGTLDPVLSFTDRVAEHGETTPRPDDSSSEGSNSDAATELVADPAFPAPEPPEAPAPPPTSQQSSIAVEKNLRPSGNGSPPSMKDMMAELASKAKAREERSALPSSETTIQPIDQKSDARPGGQSSPPSMKDMMAELASKAKAREERSALPPAETPTQPIDQKSDARPGGQSSSPSMKDMMAELASKAKAREERSALPPSETPTQPIDQKSDARPGGQSSPPSMKDMMAELASKAKAREGRSASSSPQTTTASHTSPHPAEPVFSIEASIQPPPLPPPPPPPPKHQQGATGTSNQANKNTAKPSKPVSMKDMMAELEMKANARANRNIT